MLIQMDRELFTRKEVASIFGVTPHTVLRWGKKNLLVPRLYINGRPRYHVEDFEKVYTDRQTTYNNQKKKKDAAEESAIPGIAEAAL